MLLVEGMDGDESHVSIPDYQVLSALLAGAVMSLDTGLSVDILLILRPQWRRNRYVKSCAAIAVEVEVRPILLRRGQVFDRSLSLRFETWM